MQRIRSRLQVQGQAKETTIKQELLRKDVHGQTKIAMNSGSAPNHGKTSAYVSFCSKKTKSTNQKYKQAKSRTNSATDKQKIADKQIADEPASNEIQSLLCIVNMYCLNKINKYHTHICTTNKQTCTCTEYKRATTHAKQQTDDTKAVNQSTPAHFITSKIRS